MLNIKEIFKRIRENKTERIIELIKDDPTVVNSTIHSGLTPLMYAVIYNNDLETIFCLIDHGADLQQKDVYNTYKDSICQQTKHPLTYFYIFF